MVLMPHEIKHAAWGKNSAKRGEVPAIALNNPKYAANVGMAVRLAACWGFKQVWWSGDRVTLDVEQKQRLPREERMKGYEDVSMIQHDYFFDQMPGCVEPVAIEVSESSQLLTNFEHPTNALYVFGPEDGSINKAYLRHCHYFVQIPSRHCLNLATAIATILWDRYYKMCNDGREDLLDFTTPGQWENRGVEETDPGLLGIYEKRKTKPKRRRPTRT